MGAAGWKSHGSFQVLSVLIKELVKTQRRQPGCTLKVGKRWLLRERERLASEKAPGGSNIRPKGLVYQNSSGE